MKISQTRTNLLGAEGSIAYSVEGPKGNEIKVTRHCLRPIVNMRTLSTQSLLSKTVSQGQASCVSASWSAQNTHSAPGGVEQKGHVSQPFLENNHKCEI